jgi:hypothetical protein
MNAKLATMITSAIVTGLLAQSTAQAEEHTQQEQKGPQMSDGKAKCNTVAKPDDQQPEDAKKKKEKGACKTACGAKQMPEQKGQ